MPGQAMRQQSSIRLKLNAIRAEFANKIVLLVDDSMVRGTTSKEIIQMERDVGAKKYTLLRRPLKFIILMCMEICLQLQN